MADLRIFNPDGSEAELSGNGAREAILYLRRRGWTDQDSSRSHTAAGRDPPDDHRARAHAASTWAARALDLRGLPGRCTTTGAGELVAGGRAWQFQHVSIGNPQCAIHVEDLASWRRSTCRRSARRSKATSCFPTARTCPGTPRLEPGRAGGTRSARGSSSAGWGRRSPRARGRAAPRSPTRVEYAGGAAPRPVDGAARRRRVARSRWVRICSVNLTGWARPVFEGRLSEDFEKELHETE